MTKRKTPGSLTSYQSTIKLLQCLFDGLRGRLETVEQHDKLYSQQIQELRIAQEFWALKMQKALAKIEAKKETQQ